MGKIFLSFLLKILAISAPSKKSFFLWHLSADREPAPSQQHSTEFLEGEDFMEQTFSNKCLIWEIQDSIKKPNMLIINCNFLENTTNKISDFVCLFLVKVTTATQHKSRLRQSSYSNKTIKTLLLWAKITAAIFIPCFWHSRHWGKKKKK